MKKIIESGSGIYFSIEEFDGGSTTSPIFSKNSTKTRMADGVEEAYNVYDDLVNKGYELVQISKSEKDAYEENQVKAGIISEISALEAKVTPRRSREAMLTGDYSFIQNIEDQIKALSVRK
tara:strand:+ start:704 stop:1066 length:363 start_codon:yes stop_codon:yes gene_type:complete